MNLCTDDCGTCGKSVTVDIGGPMEYSGYKYGTDEHGKQIVFYMRQPSPGMMKFSSVYCASCSPAILERQGMEP